LLYQAVALRITELEEDSDDREAASKDRVGNKLLPFTLSGHAHLEGRGEDRGLGDVHCQEHCHRELLLHRLGERHLEASLQNNCTSKSYQKESIVLGLSQRRRQARGQSRAEAACV